MLKQTIKNIISFFIIFNFLIVQTFAATGISAEQRTIEIQNDMIESGVPSDLPIAGYSDFFDKETVSLIKNFNLSPYSNMKIMVGYGLPDKNSNNCKMLEKPDPDNPGKMLNKNDFDKAFIKFIVFNDHSYGIATRDTDYNGCLTLANKFGGYPVVIDSAGENNSIKHTFLTSNSNESLWLGISWTDQNNPVYFNAFGKKQHYFKWENREEYAFNINKPNIYMQSNGKWKKESPSVIKKCIVEIESPTYYKPVRSCVPWWKIIREFKNDRESLYNRKDYNKLLHADIPEKLSICTKYDEDVIEDPNNPTPTRDVTCTSYQSATVKPECSLNIDLPQCYVDECSGYIQNACRHKDQKIVGKGYIKGELKDKTSGQLKEVKIKDHVTTHTFTCPPSSLSMKHCLETSKVIIFPKECTMYGSNCADLKECVQNAMSNEEIDKCYDVDNGGYFCDKVYAQRDIPPKLDADGNVELLYGICRNPNDPNDTTQVEFVPNILDKKSKHCVEREILEIEEQIQQKCQTERTYTEHTVDTSITEIDAYQDNPNCVRIDKVKDSETATNVSMTVDLYNFSKLKITQTYIDGKEETVGNIVGDDTYYKSLAVPKDDIMGGSDNLAADATQECDIESVSKCSNMDYDNSWYQRNADVFLDGVSYDTKDDLVAKIEGSKVYILGTTTNLTNALCSSYPSDHGFSSYTTGSPTYMKNDISGTAQCVWSINTMSGDAGMEKMMALTVDASKYFFSNAAMTKEDCLKKAYCLGGAYDESPYGASWTSTGKCEVSVDGSGSPSSYTTYLKEKAGCDTSATNDVEEYDESTCKPIEDKSSTNFNTVIDGLQSILFFEGIIGGGWGYYANFNGYSYKSNEVFITADDISNLRVFPLVEISTLNDALTYVGNIKHIGWRKGEPDVAMAAVGGAGAGILAYSPLLALGGPAAWAIGIIVFVIILLLSKSKKMDEQAQVWVIYKNVADERYIRGPYETRKDMPSSATYSQATRSDGSATVRITAPQGTANHLYMTINTETGVNFPSDYLKTLDGYTKAKKNLMICSGIPASEVAKTIYSSLETTISTGYPKCKWYKPWCEKHEVKADVKPTMTLYKPTTTVYLGATNTLTVLVPYKGDYTLRAYNKYDEVIAEREVTEDTFSNYFDPLAVPYGKVQFGSAMTPSVNLGTGSPCLDDMMVEWGGGVSGIYFENDTTGYNNGCAKSDDVYVQEQAMVKIEVQPMNMETSFVHILEKPMPYPNRVFIASLEKMAKRKYRCYDPFEECDDTDYIQIEDE